VIDIGASSLAGDRRLDPIASAVYLSDPHLTPTATVHDATSPWRSCASLGHAL
jgi:hypothetical protein